MISKSGRWPRNPARPSWLGMAAGTALVLAMLAAAAAVANATAATATTTNATAAAKPAVATKPPATAKPATTTKPSGRSRTATPTKAKTAPSATSSGQSAPTDAAPDAAPDAKPDQKDMSLKGGQEGTVFRSLTVEGEDRIHVDFDRPELNLDLDPAHAPGLEWGSARDVLDRTSPDFVTPLVGWSARQASPYLGRPWLSEFATGPVARFQPAVEGVERWKLTVVDARGQSVAAFAGRGNPPKTIEWDGRTTSGAPVTPGLTYSYVFEAYDRAGNRRNFVGQGFSVDAYHLDTAEGPVLLFSGRDLASGSATDRGPAPQGAAAPIVLEAASWLNQTAPGARAIQISATARTSDQAGQLADAVTRGLASRVMDPARLRPITVVQADAPEGGTVTIAPGR